MPGWKYPAGGLIPLPYHHTMLADTPRCEAFASAIERIVRPGDVVLDVGTGTGLLAYFAARRGARQVYAVEADPGVANAARDFIALNHLTDRITLIEGRAEDVSPPEQVDVVICEMLHVGLMVEQQVPVLNAIRAKLDRSQPDHSYRVIPGQVINYCQLVAAGFEFHGYRAPMVRFGNTYVVDPSVTALSDLTPYLDTDLTVTIDPVVKAAVDVRATAAGTVNAIRMLTQAVLWFDQAQPVGQQFIEWYLNFLIVPLETEMTVEPGHVLRVNLDYTFGQPLEELRLGTLR